ncbi:MAG: hypothetical protein HYS12_12745 [Planctomycetes bacterium]|nr:hypothetical protein [Planctomycetota bacterium]
MRVSALPAWLFVLLCVLLGTSATSYYYLRVASVEEPTDSDERVRTGDPGDSTAPTSGPRPKPGPKAVLLLVIQTRLVTQSQSELAHELREIRKEHAQQLIDGSVWVVNRAGRSTWDLSSPLPEDQAFANNDIKRALGKARETVSALQDRLRTEDRKPAVLLVWGNDVDPTTVPGLTKEDVRMPRPVALFWIGYANDCPWLIEALGKGSVVCRLDRDIQNLSHVYLPEYFRPQRRNVP